MELFIILRLNTLLDRAWRNGDTRVEQAHAFLVFQRAFALLHILLHILLFLLLRVHLLSSPIIRVKVRLIHLSFLSVQRALDELNKLLCHHLAISLVAWLVAKIVEEGKRCLF